MGVSGGWGHICKCTNVHKEITSCLQQKIGPLGLLPKEQKPVQRNLFSYWSLVEMQGQVQGLDPGEGGLAPQIAQGLAKG